MDDYTVVWASDEYQIGITPIHAANAQDAAEQVADEFSTDEDRIRVVAVFKGLSVTTPTSFVRRQA